MELLRRSGEQGVVVSERTVNRILTRHGQIGVVIVKEGTCYAGVGTCRQSTREVGYVPESDMLNFVVGGFPERVSVKFTAVEDE